MFLDAAVYPYSLEEIYPLITVDLPVVVDPSVVVDLSPAVEPVAPARLPAVLIGVEQQYPALDICRFFFNLCGVGCILSFRQILHLASTGPPR